MATRRKLKYGPLWMLKQIQLVFSNIFVIFFFFFKATNRLSYLTVLDDPPL